MRIEPLRIKTAQAGLRPTPLLKLSLLRLLDPKLPAISPKDMRTPPLEIEILLESSPPKSRISVQRFAAAAEHAGHRAPRLSSLLLIISYYCLFDNDILIIIIIIIIIIIVVIIIIYCYYYYYYYYDYHYYYYYCSYYYYYCYYYYYYCYYYYYYY